MIDSAAMNQPTSRASQNHFLSPLNKNLHVPKNSKAKKLNTISGVFLPCIQAILNVILFLRLPSITAQAGVIQTTAIILACVTSTFITAISLSAIATNGTIRQGGPYYVISRTLGLEVGGALGLLFYLGSTMACSMCVLGGVEAFLLSIRGDAPVISDMTGGALGGSYESVDEIVIGDGLTRRLLLEQNEVIMQQMEDLVHIIPASSIEYIVAEPEITYSSMEFMAETQNLSMLLVLILTIVVSTGCRSALKLSSHVFLVLMLLSIFSACLGCLLFASDGFTGDLQPYDKLSWDNIYPRYEPDPNTGVTPTFMSLLALFYPSVTGILAGSNNSENLADPAMSIPNGTLGAIISSTIIYIGFAWIFGTTIANQTLKSRKFIVAAIAYPSATFVKIGVLVSVWGAALDYMSSATTMISAIAMDDSMPILNFIRRGQVSSKKDDGTGKDGDQQVNKRALMLTWALVSLPTLAGNLDYITPLTTMCNLLMYAGINFSCFLLGSIQSPGFRPTFKYFNYWISLFGMVWCLTLAFLIDTAMACLALAMFLVLLAYNHKMVEKRRDWGDVFDSVKYNVVTQTLQSLSHTTTSDLNAKNWRPQLLTFVDMDSQGMPTNLYLLSLASQLKKGKGINIVVGIILRDLCQSQPQLEGHQGMEDENIVGALSKSKDALQGHMQQERMDGFAKVSVVTTRGGMCDAVWSAVLHSGLGPLSPNTILLSFPSKHERNGPDQYWSENNFLKTITGIRNLKVALMIFRGCHLYPRAQELVTSGVIDVWWIIHDGGLLLLLPYILSKNAVWGKGGAQLRIFAVLTSRADTDLFEDAVRTHLQGARIIASVTVVDMSDYTLEADMRNGQTSRTIHDLDSSEPSSTHDKTLSEVFCEHQGNGQTPRTSQDLDSSETSSTDDETLSEVFCEHQAHAPHALLSKQTEIDLGHADGEAYSDDVSTSSNITMPLLDGNADDGFEKIRKSRERIRNASAINEVMRLHSSCSNLVVTNMPHILSQYSCDFFEYVDTMCEGLDNVLLVRGSGKEVVTTYA